MNRSDLADYSKWVGLTPKVIRDAARAAGGWQNVFTNRLPLWAHRIRNYMNEEPMWLKRYDAYTSRNFLGLVQSGLNQSLRWRKIKALKKHPVFGQLPEVKKLPNPPPNTSDLAFTDDFAETFALSDYVYKDNNNSTWFQMSPGATIYHWGSDPSKNSVVAALEAGWQTGKQALLPVFKLVAPDGTGGSSETIVKNPQIYRVKLPVGPPLRIGRVAIGEVDQVEVVFDKLLQDSWHQGSYNYCETVNVGLAAHERFDVDTHKTWKNVSNVYVNPQRFVPLTARRFPETAPGETKPLAEQINGP